MDYKQNFIDAFKTALSVTKYQPPKYSTSAITIKVVDKKNNKICYCCDFAIIYYGNLGKNNSYYHLRNNKKQKVYEFVFRINPDIKEKENYIRHEDNGWNRIREEYLNLKNINKKRNVRFLFILRLSIMCIIKLLLKKVKFLLM